MTHEEALAELKDSTKGSGYQCHMETYEMAIEALEKQVPMKPNVYKGEYAVHYKCPKCGCRFVSKIDGEYVAGTHYKYCYICGQRIGWEGVE